MGVETLGDASTAAIGAVRDGGLAPMEVAEVETLRLPPSLLSVSVDAH